MYRYTSEELKAVIAQLNSGLINEVEFLMSMQVTEPMFNRLEAFNALDAAERNWKFQLDDFNSWRNLGESKPATQTPPVRIEGKYKNCVLAAILRDLKEVEVFKDDLDKYVKVEQDNPKQWAIHTAEQFYYIVNQTVKKVCKVYMVDYTSAATQSPNWDVFCSA